MPTEAIHACGCGSCRLGEAHHEREPDQLLFEITGVDEKAIRRAAKS